jgi:hypothetical protein
MRNFILSLFILLNFNNLLMAGGSLTDDVSALGRRVPYAQLEVMKMNFDICVCENETPEQAAKTIAEVLKHFPDCLPSLQMLPTAPSHLVAHFGDIKVKVDQIVNNESSELLVADATELMSDDSSSSGNGEKSQDASYGISVSVQNQETSQGYFVFHRSSPIAFVRTDTAYAPTDSHFCSTEREDQKDTTLLANHDVNGPKNPSSGDHDAYVSAFISSSNGIFVKAAHDDHLIQPVISTSVKDSLSGFENKNLTGTRVPTVIHDTHMKAQQAIEENSSLLKTSARSLQYSTPRYLEVGYIMFLLTILANYFSRLLKPHALAFVRFSRRLT